MNSALSVLAINAVTENTTSGTINGRLYRTYLFNIDLSETPVSGSADVIVEYNAPGGVWRELITATIDNTVTGPNDMAPIKLTELPVSSLRIRVANYSSLVGSPDPIEVSVGVCMG